MTSWVKGGNTAAASGGSGSSAPAPAAGGASSSSGNASGPALSFAITKARADHVDSPLIAIQLWQKFIDAKPNATDLASAKTELANWQKLQDENAELINGKWIGGEEKKELLKRVDEMVKQGYAALEGDQALEGVKQLEDALKLYPNSFDANYGVGYVYLFKGAIGANGRGNVLYQDKAIKSLEAAAKINPTSAGVWSNLAIGYNFRGRYLESIQAAYKGAKIEDSKEIVSNLCSSIAYAPPGLQSNERVKPIMEDALVLASKRGVNPRGAEWFYIHPKPPGEETIKPSEIAEEGKPGPAWRGTGFFISSDGYLITNHHVATGDPHGPVLKNISFLVKCDDGTEKNAELIAVDDKSDIALMKIKPENPVAYLKLADDNPKQAAQSLVLGYPATGLEEPTMQVAAGDVASINPGDEHEVWFHLETTHGNSGGPIVDKDCRVIGMLSAGRTVYNVTYALGIGPKQIKAFLTAMGDKGPHAEYAPSVAAEFNGEALTDQAKKATVLVIAIRGGEKTDDAAVKTVSTGAATHPDAPPKDAKANP